MATMPRILTSATNSSRDAIHGYRRAPSLQSVAAVRAPFFVYHAAIFVGNSEIRQHVDWAHAGVDALGGRLRQSNANPLV
jgi:hypothetical protein